VASEKQLRQLLNRSLGPHGHNLLHKLKTYYGRKGDHAAALERLVPRYVALRDAWATADAFSEGLISVVAGVDSYLQELRTPPADVFATQGDFITSLLPEFFLYAFDTIARDLGAPFRPSGQRDIVIDLSLDVQHPGRVVPRTQRVDVAVLEPCEMVIGGTTLPDFAIPVIAAEVKTYFDKNMISGVVFSFDALRSTFPGCMCLAISEFADFDPKHQTYAAASIDEFYILRQQKRSEFRNSGIASPIAPDLVASILQLVRSYLAQLSMPRPDLHERMKTGKLIELGARPK
jgi:hypothetical protein